MSRGALDGLVILDLTRVLAGPLSTMLLGDMGAEVIKIERPGTGDDTRAWGPPFVGGESAYYLGVNRNKRSLTLDLSTEEGRGILRRLVPLADVVVVRRGSMPKTSSGKVKRIELRRLYLERRLDIVNA